MDLVEEDSAVQQDDRELLMQLLEYMEASLVGFRAQIHNRNELYNRIRTRLHIEEATPYEDFFATYFEQMNLYEKRLHKVIRNYTDYIRANNEQSRLIVIKLKHLDKEIPKLSKLRRHLDFWLHKYDTLFSPDPAMCLVYTGVGDKVPFPKGVEEEVMAAIEKKDQRSIK